MANQANNRSRARVEADKERSYRSTSRSQKSAKGKKNRNGRKAAIITICIAVIAIIAGIIAGVSYFSKYDDNGLIYENITVAGVDVGGMTKTDAINAVRLATKDTYSVKTMVVQVLDETAELSPALTGAKLDADAAVEAAYNFGRTGTSSQQQKDQLTALTHGYAVDITPYLSLDTEAIKNAINALGANYSSTLSQTSYKIDGDEDKTLVITIGTPEYALDLNALYDAVLSAYNANTFTAEGNCSVVEPDALDLQAIHDKYCIAPVDAKIDPETFEVIKEVNGYGFVVADVKEKLENAKYGETLEIPFTKIAPEITSDSISNTLYRDVLGTFTARAESEENRDTNLAVACKAINGMILYPGDVFSYNDALGERTAENGYKPGPSYAGNETVYTLGGGICQVSTALYYCTLVADLEIIHRDNHGFLPTYAQYGMDAVVSWGTLDFMFRNNTDYPICIKAEANGGVVTVELIGTDDKDYYIEMDYKILKEDPAETVEVTYPADNPQGYEDGDYIVEPYNGYEVETYKCKYDKQTKALLSQELEATSIYRRRDGKICKIEVPVTPPETTPETTPDTTPTYPDDFGGGAITDGGGDLPEE